MSGGERVNFLGRLVTELEKDNKNQIDQILNIIKIASLAFPAIAFLQYSSKQPDFLLTMKHNVMLIAILIIILLVYTLWIVIQSKIKDKDNFKMSIDHILSMSISLMSIMMTGSYESSYKFLFLFVIVFSSIECNRGVSLSIAGLSAIIVLGVDLIFAPKTNVNTYFEGDIVLACAFMIISWTIGYYDDLRKNHIDYLKDLANVDGLTGLYNHRCFYDYLTEQFALCKKDGREISLLFIDIDNFKYYNDLYGHQRGDEVLRTMAIIMKDTLPAGAFVARYGGEEFAILFPGFGEKRALTEAEKLRKAVQEYQFEGQVNLPGENLTISVGVSTFPAKAKTDAELLKGADDACYRAKFLCKNRVESYFCILDELQFGTETIAPIKTLIAVINAKDKYTYRHIERVVFYCTLVADKIGLSEADKKKLIYSAYLHDIGKISISEEILTKTEPLTQEEWETLKSHPQNAVEIIKNIDLFQDVIPIIQQHHERFDGKGYPGNLTGYEINPLARLLTVADSFDAMTSIRPYQQIKTYAQAIDELRRCSGTQFDPDAVTAFIDSIGNRL